MARIRYFMARDAIQSLWIEAEWKDQQTERKPIDATQNGIWIRRSERNNHWTKHVQIYLSFCANAALLVFGSRCFFSVRSFVSLSTQTAQQTKTKPSHSKRATNQTGKQSYAYQCIMAIQKWRFIHGECVWVSARAHVCTAACCYFQVYLIHVLSFRVQFFFQSSFSLYLPLFHNANAGFIWASR